MQNNNNQIGIMPIYRDLYPHQGDVGERFIIKKLKQLHLRDCLMILSDLSKYSFKYCNNNNYGEKGSSLYRKRCIELLDAQTVVLLEQSERDMGKKFDVIFPELSILHLYKLCLKYCDINSYYKGQVFPKQTLYTLGTCLLVSNCIFADQQLKGTTDNNQFEQLTINFTKQVIAVSNIDVYQKFYQTFFLFQYTEKISTQLNLEKIFNELYGVGMEEYLAFSFVLLSQFVIKNNEEEDYVHSYIDETALSNQLPPPEAVV